MGVIMRDLQQHDAACNWRKTQHGQNRSLHLPGRGQPGTTHCGNELNSTEWHIEKDSIQGVESERLNDQGTKCSNATAGDTVLMLAMAEWQK